jgi:hypothetical protein
MKRQGGLGIVEGGKKPDIVTVKIIQRAMNTMGFIAFAGACDLHTFEETLEAFETQGYLDLIDHEATKMRIFKEGTLGVIHIGTKPQQPKGIIVPGMN